MSIKNFFERSGTKALSLLFLLSIVCCIADLSGQKLPPQERFRHLTIDDGLSQNAVQAMLQDHSGLIWIGTKDGLNRYDGYEFIVYQYLPGEQSSLSNNFVLDIFEDRDQQLWIGTKNGLNRYDRKTDTFIAYFFPQFATGKDPNVPISLITQDQEGNLWLAANGKNLVRLPNVNGTVDVEHPTVVADSFTDLYHLFQDGQHLWVGDQSGLHRYDISGREISRHLLYTRQPGMATSKKDSSVTYILAGKDPNFLWLGNPSGIAYFEKKTGKYQFYPNHYDNHRYGWGLAQFIAADPSDGKLWIGSADELMRFDPRTEKYEYFYSRPDVRHGFHGEGILCAMLDQSGQIWFGTNGYGINIYNGRHSGIKTLIHQIPEASRLKNFSIRGIFKDQRNNVWISSNVLYRWNRQTGEMISYEQRPDWVEAMGNTTVWNIIQDHEDWLWLATNEGIYRYHVPDSTVQFYKHIPGDPTSLPERSVFNVYEDSQNRIWAITRNYFVRMDRETGQFTSIKYRDYHGAVSSFARILEDRQGKFWINSEIGLIHFDPESGAFRTFQHDPEDNLSIGSNIIRSICPDPEEPDRYLWLGTAGGGLNKFEIASGHCRQITTEDGLPDNVIYSVLADDQGTLWMSTNKGLSHFDPISFTFKNYDLKDGLQSNEFNSGAYHQGEDGELFFGGILGLNYFYPYELADNNHIAQIHITGLMVGNQRIRPGDTTGILQHNIGTQKDIRLTYQDDIVTFLFAAMDFTAPEKNQFRYKLEGWDKNWVDAGIRRTATYTNLPAGHYSFLVMGSNNDGVWNDSVTSLNLTISPPFWMTWWAKLIYLALLLGLLYAGSRYNHKRIVLKHQLAIETVEREKLQELDQLKSKFFTDISHEFRTPLTLISGPIDQLKASVQNSSDQKMLEVMERHVHQMLSMVNQILDLSRLEMGKERLNETQGDLIARLRGVTMSCRSMAENLNIELAVISRIEAADCFFDPQKVEQILLNLLSNAMKYTGRGGQVALIIEDVPDFDPDQDQKVPFSFSVQDNGPGIAEQDVQQIFQRYYRAEDSKEHNRTGSGIGLAIVKELVDLHGGRIEVQSVMGKGTTFRVSLPLHLLRVVYKDVETINHWIPEPHGNGKPPQPSQPEKNVWSPEEERDVVLVVEDNPEVRHFIGDVLGGSFVVCEAENGTEGLARAKEMIPDLIITDVMMPGMNGLDLCRELTHDALTSHIPVIVLTAKSSQEDKMSGYAVGADAFITKPFKSNELLLRTQSLIERRRALQKNYLLNRPWNGNVKYRNSSEAEFIKNIQDTLQAHLSNPDLGIATLANAVSMSERQLRRKIKAIFGQAPNQCIRTYRLRQAHELLRSGAGNVSEVCFEVGFNNVSYFSKCFREEFGMSPSEL